MCVLSKKVPIRKKSGNLFNEHLTAQEQKGRMFTSEYLEAETFKKNLIDDSDYKEGNVNGDDVDIRIYYFNEVTDRFRMHLGHFRSIKQVYVLVISRNCGHVNYSHVY